MVVTEEIEQRLSMLVATAKRGSLGEEESGEFESRIKKIKSKLKSLQERGDSAGYLAEFSTSKRKMLNEVFEVIYESELPFSCADELYWEDHFQVAKKEAKQIVGCGVGVLTEAVRAGG